MIVPWRRSVWQNLDQEKNNQDVWNYLRTTLPYDKLKYNYFYHKTQRCVYWARNVNIFLSTAFSIGNSASSCIDCLRLFWYGL